MKESIHKYIKRNFNSLIKLDKERLIKIIRNSSIYYFIYYCNFVFCLFN